MKIPYPLSVEPLESRIAPAAAVIDLSSLDGNNGFKLSGEATDDKSGYSVSDAGDVNGDGFADLIIGAFGAASSAPRSGAGYVVFGRASGFAINLDLSTLDGSNGFEISGAAADDRAGFSVSAAGDVNGDGHSDLIIGAYTADPNGEDSGASYVVFGRSSGFAANLNLASLDGSNGFKLSGVATGDHVGFFVGGAGDVNNDGFDDVIIGAPNADPHGFDSGASYVVFGRGIGFTANLNLSTLDGSNGFKLSGVASNDNAGQSVGGAGDLNGDGFDDVIVGAPGVYANGFLSGASYVVFGQANGFAANLELSTVNGSNGFKISGVTINNIAGGEVSGAGDVNGDGFGDLIIAAVRADGEVGDSGAGYVVFGKAAAFTANLELSALDGSNGFKLSGVAASDFAGSSVSAAGDVNGDGFDDVIIGADSADGETADSGASYVVFGRPGGFAANLNLSTLDGSNGFKLGGVQTGDLAGRSASAAGDVDGDGLGDLIIGAMGAGPNGSQSIYVVFGRATATVSINDVTVAEGGSGTSLATFTVSLSAPSTQTITVQYATTDGTANAPGDYTTAGLTTLTFAPGQTTKTVSVSIGGDATVESNEAFFVNLSNASNATIADSQGQGTILNDDVSVTPVLSINDVTLAEGASGIVTASFTVSLSQPGPGAITVQYATSIGTASESTDYISSGLTTLTFAPGEITKVVEVTIAGDRTIEPDETFFIDLSSAIGATVADAQGQGTILNDDFAVVIAPAGNLVTFADADGDQVTIETSKGLLTAENLIFAPDGTLRVIDLLGDIRFDGANVTISANSLGTGNGLVDVGLFDAASLDLGKVSITGNLGSILAGDGDPTKPALKKLTVGTLGTSAAVVEPLLSEFRGALDKLKVVGDVRGAAVNVQGKLKKITIGGDLIGDGDIGATLLASILEGRGIGLRVSGGIPVGAFSASEIGAFKVNGNMNGGSVTTDGDIDSVTVGKDLQGTAVAAAGQIKEVKIVGKLTSDVAARPAVLAALARLDSTRPAGAIAIDSMQVGGDVANAQILLGYRKEDVGGVKAFIPRNPDAGSGKIVIKGNWTASSLVAGVFDATGDGFGMNDQPIEGDTTANISARIASIIIEGTATGSATAGDHYGITAQDVGKLSIAGQKVTLTKGLKDSVLLDLVNGDFRLVEV